MAYYTGSAANVAAVLTALTNACEAEDWTWSGGILSKADPGIFVRLDAATTIDGYTPLRLWGRTYIDSGESPQYVSMNVPIKAVDVTYPVTYHVFVFASEVFLVINYSDKFQWLAFGQSSQPGLGSSGNWVAATAGNTYWASDPNHGVYINLNGGGLVSGYWATDAAVVPAMFWPDLNGANITDRFYACCASWYFDAGLESGDTYHPWMQPCDGASNKNLVQILATQPNSFNNEGVLIPITLFMIRAESKFSQVLQVQNARHIRVDNYTPTEIITLGTDQWMVFPWYCKSTTDRNGGTSANLSHSGTFGWAIKYEPPA